MKKEEKKEEKKDYWICERCNINSNTKDRMIPCPRGGCEATIAGEIIVTQELILFDKKNEQIYNSQNTIGLDQIR